MKKLIFGLLFLVGCATPTRYDACTQVNAGKRFDGYTVYSCPHPFLTMGYQDRGYAADSKTTGYGYGANWKRGITDKSTHEVFFWDRFPESLDHEAQHVAGTIRDDQ